MLKNIISIFFLSSFSGCGLVWFWFGLVVVPPSICGWWVVFTSPGRSRRRWFPFHLLYNAHPLPLPPPPLIGAREQTANDPPPPSPPLPPPHPETREPYNVQIISILHHLKQHMRKRKKTTGENEKIDKNERAKSWKNKINRIKIR